MKGDRSSDSEDSESDPGLYYLLAELSSAMASNRDAVGSKSGPTFNLRLHKPLALAVVVVARRTQDRTSTY
jgi:hypothetical protein